MTIANVGVTSADCAVNYEPSRTEAETGEAVNLTCDAANVITPPLPPAPKTRPVRQLATPTKRMASNRILVSNIMLFIFMKDFTINQ